MAPVHMKVILRLFGVAFIAMLVNAHLFQSVPRGRVLAQADVHKDGGDGPSALVPVAEGEQPEQWRSRLRYEGLPPRSRGDDDRTEVTAKPPAVSGTARFVLPKRRDESLKAPVRSASKLVRAVQRELTSLGYEPGPVDGVEGLMTQAAIMAYQHDKGLGLTGRSTEALLKQIIFGGPLLSQAETETAKAVKNRRRVIKTVQLKLGELGYKPGAANGVMGEDTRNAIKAFERYSGLVATGRVSGRLIGKLSNVPHMRIGAIGN